MRTLIIGSEGNVGRPLAAHMRNSGHEVREIDIRSGYRDGYVMADINHPIDLIDSFMLWDPEVVLLLSAIVSRVTCEKTPSLAISTNLGGLTNVIELCKKANSRLVFFSTSEVYGPDHDPMQESDDNLVPNNRYGLSKLLGEQLVQYEAREHNLRAVILRPFMIYDENEDLGDHRSAMIRFALGLYNGRAITVHRGAQRSWLHAYDAVIAIERAAQLDLPGAPIINIGHPDVRPVSELAELVRWRFAVSPDLIREAELPPRMTMVKRPSLERQLSLLGYEPRVGVEEGVKLVCDRMWRRPDTLDVA